MADNEKAQRAANLVLRPNTSPVSALRMTQLRAAPMRPSGWNHVSMRTTSPLSSETEGAWRASSKGDSGISPC